MTILDLHPFIQVLGVGILVLNLVVTRALMLDDGATGPQKFAQTLFVWCIPFLGAGLVLALIGSHHSRAEMKSMAPFPFYLVAYKKPGQQHTASGDAGACGAVHGGKHPDEGSCGEASCGSD